MHHFEKILLVDDDAATNFLAELAFRNLNIANEIQVASDGLMASLLLKQHSCPDIIFLDIRMPRMDGFEFLENMTRMDLCQNVKIVMLTSSTRLEDKKKALAYNVVIDYIEKPLTEELIKKIAATHFHD
jgi:CheY-like chemotaxis protein